MIKLTNRKRNRAHKNIFIMKQQVLYIFIFIFGLSLQGCVIYGLTNDYAKLNQEEQKLISKFNPSEELEAKKIYEITASQLKEEFKKFEKSMVYTFTNGCTSEYCIPLSVYENYAKENGYHLFLVMNGYANLEETLCQKITSPLFVINAQAYDTKWRARYSKRFRNELEGLHQDTKYQYHGSIYFFERDSFVSVEKKLPE